MTIVRLRMLMYDTKTPLMKEKIGKSNFIKIINFAL